MSLTLAFFFIGCLFRLRIVDNQTLGPDTPAELATPLHLTFLNPFSYCLTFAPFLHAQCSRHVFNAPRAFRFVWICSISDLPAILHYPTKALFGGMAVVMLCSIWEAFSIQTRDTGGNETEQPLLEPVSCSDWPRLVLHAHCDPFLHILLFCTKLHFHSHIPPFKLLLISCLRRIVSP